MFNSATGQLVSNVLLKQRYRILYPVGQGGMGAVYAAEDTQLGNRKVALKEMRQSGLSPQEVSDAANAFRQEALLLAALQNPHLPNIYDHFNEFGRWYLVMSFISGETLEEYLAKASENKLPLDEVLQIGIQLCSVLDYLHAQQPPIIFRDLKPTNIMRTGDGHIYLIDFGIARLFKPGQAKDTSSYGSMGYASPEQYGRAQTMQQSDIYSLGAVLHQLLSGHQPSATPFRFPSLQAAGQPLPNDLVTLIEQMLNLDETKRPTSVAEVKRKLQSIAATPAKAAPLPPTIPATPPPAPAKTPVQAASPPVALKPPIQRASPVVAPAPAKQMSVWSIGKRQIFAMLIGVVMFGIADYAIGLVLLSSSANPQLTNSIIFNITLLELLGALTLIVPLFFSLKFGPWVGLASSAVGALVGDYLSKNTPFAVTPWYYYVNIALLGIIASFAFLKTRGYYKSRRAIGLAIFISTIGLIVYSLIEATGDSISYHNGWGATFSAYLPLTFANIIVVAVLLPIILRITNKIRGL